MTDPAETVIRRFLACFPPSDLDDVLGFFSDDAVYADGPRGVHIGIQAIRAELQSFLAMAPDTTMKIKNLAASGGTIFAERVDYCEINGNRVGFECVGVFDVNPDGRITRWRDYYDWPTFVEQITAATAART